jgi:DNA-binding winged helix-turn-helix (wHTH) protein/tetratricopeptide (TPR) repeat protein
MRDPAGGRHSYRVQLLPRVNLSDRLPHTVSSRPVVAGPETDFSVLSMVTEPKVLYEFGPFQVDPDKQVLLREDQPVAITPKVFETLLILVRHSREVVSKDELMKAVWPDAFVEEANLSQNIFMLRKALGDTPEDRRYIVTLPGRGYRFAAQVRTVMQDGEDLIIESRSRSQMVVQQMNSSPGEALHAHPTRLHRKMVRKYLLPIAAVLALLVVGTAFLLRKHRPIGLGQTDSVLVADFTNTTGDPVFDGTLRQGLAVQLEQSPFLNLVSEDRIQQALRMMGQPPDARLSPEVAREICERTASTAVLDGSIAQIGTQYLLTLKAVNCASGESLTSTDAQASGKNHVLDALAKTASEIRSRLGESLSTVQKFDTPLEQATTPSLEALKAFSSGRKVESTEGDAAAIPFFKHAIELDPNFALAYAWLGLMYVDLGESSVAAEYTRKAYELRDRTSEAEKYFITSRFHKVVTGNMEKAEQACQLWIQAYPRSETPHNLLSGAIYPVTGQYEKGIEAGREAVRLNPHFPPSYALLMSNYTALSRLDEARAAYDQALERKLKNSLFHRALYQIAFLQNDAAGMAQQVARSAGTPGVEDKLLGLEADTAAYSGRLRNAREFSRRAMDSAERAEENEPAAMYAALSGLREALFGNAEEARWRATSAIRRSTDRDVQYGAALAFAFAGDNSRAQALTDDLGKRFPEATIVQFNYLPTLRAKLAISRGNASEAIESLGAAAQYELGHTTSSTYGWTALYPVLVRGEAYLAAHNGSEAAAEFQKILGHRGIVVNEPIGALAHLSLARAYAIQGETAKARAAYQDFLTLWKDADPDIYVLKQAKAEYAKLQ